MPSRRAAWWQAVRPRTLVLAAAPVLLGSALAWADGHAPAWAALAAALACALLIQTATNLHNDAADAARGTDTAERIGPLRVTAAGWLPARAVRRAAVGCGLAALALGAGLVARGGWPILVVGLASLAAAWAYSGGPRPVSHSAWGELTVFVFFGLVAVGGSHWLQALQPAWPAVLAGGTALGAPAAAVLLVNNYRDLEGDLRSGRRTWVSRLGRPGARRAYALLMATPLAAVAALVAMGRPGAGLAGLAAPLLWRLVRRLGRQPPGPWLNDLLAGTARAAALVAALASMGLLWWR